ncbi:MAG: peptidylprolyl isomerase [Candidatus Tectomicrobia bacterium]|uniref:Periplasmic chaperone PpiD n=1 Tax=Tectimicrobiota bacterium TaxID=2528274 RepID=A0A932CQU8_UNCTE|nr:peptidylprolyl isomerase [Candidatus Tectomicrobia bacterium]
MFTILREFTRSWWFKAILLSIVGSFILTIFWAWGRGSAESPSRAIGTIQGEEITYDDFNQSYEDVYRVYSQLFANMDEEMMDAKALKKIAKEQLIRKKLLLIQAQKQGLKVSDSELAGRIQEIFRVDGRFDPARYTYFLRSERIGQQDFEARLREAMVLEKLEQLIKDGIQVSDREVKEAYQREKEQIRAEYAFLNASLFAEKVQLQEKEIADHYAHVKKSFERPDKVKVEYVRLDPSSYRSKVSVSDEEIVAHYQEHAGEYFLPRRVRARHILLRLPQGADASTEAQVKKRTEELLQEVRKGADFAQLAQRVSEDPGSAQRGGDLGYFKEGEMVKTFEQAAFALKVGAVSNPVRTEFGYHLIKVEETQPAGEAPLSQVKERIRETLLQERALRWARREAKRLHQAARDEKKGFAQATTAQGLSVQTTGLFSQNEPLPGIPSAREFATAALATPLNQVSEPIKTAEGYYLVRVVQKVPPTIPPLAEVQGEVKARLIAKKSREQALQVARELIKKAPGSADLAGLVAPWGLQWTPTGYFSRQPAAQGSTPGPERDASFTKAAFGLRQGEVGLMEAPAGVYLLRVAERKVVDEAAFQKEKDQYQRRLLQQRQEQAFQSWALHLQEQATKKGEIQFSEVL